MMARTSVLLMTVAFGFSVSPLAAQDSLSRANATTLITLMERAKTDSFAARVGGEPDLFVSVLHIPGSQLLVVSGRHPNPAALDARIAASDYRGAYGDLNGSTLRDDKLFVMDTEANGLAKRAGNGQPFDIAYENGVTTTMFSGDWRTQKLSESEYGERFARIDKRYAEMLSRLIEGLKARLTP